MARDTDRQEQFRELIERHRGIVFKVANTYAWQADDREELAQEIAAQLWRAFPGYDPARPFLTWMYRIALNVAISFVRGNSRHRNHAVRAGSAPLDLPWHVVLAGVFVHAYGVAAIALAGRTMGLIRTIDYSSPVLGIQKQLLKLRRFYIINGMIVGLPWWFMWVPVLMALAGLAGGDLYAKAPSVIWIGMGIGIAGLLATWWFHLWSRSPQRPRLTKATGDSVTGGSLRKAQAILGEISQFEAE